MGVDSVGMTLGEHDLITLWASRSEDQAYLVIEADGMHCEIRLERAQVEALRDQLPGVLAGLDRWAAEDAGCATAGRVERRAADAVARALEFALVADAVGAQERAASLRSAAAEASTRASTVDTAVSAFETATADADRAVEKLVHLTGAAATALRTAGG